MAFYSFIPLEGSMHLIRATDSMPIDKEDLLVIEGLLAKGETISEMQEFLDAVWSK
jgi:hypoxanthine-guanine phosphoribosyltransferase